MSLTAAEQIAVLQRTQEIRDLFGSRPPTADQVERELCEIGDLEIDSTPLPGDMVTFVCVLHPGGKGSVQGALRYEGHGLSAEAAKMDCLIVALRDVTTRARQGMTEMEIFLSAHSA